MKEKGTMLLITNGGERKMHYAQIDGKIYTSTGKDTNKVKQIEADNICYINDQSNKYKATIIEDSKVLEKYRNSMSRFSRIINIYIGSKVPVVIELEQI